MRDYQVVVVGAGPSGVAAALSLSDAGLRPLLIDRADHVGSSWRARYDRLKLNTGRRTSHMPNRPYPEGTAVFPTRDQVVAHLDHHAHEAGIELMLSTCVARIDKDAEGWLLATSSGDITARQVVVATGYEHTPRIPQWPGMVDYTGQVLHSAKYRNPAPFVGKRVLVVGAGSSAMEIVHDVATGGAAQAWLAVRTPPHIMLRALPGGFPSDYIASPLYDAPLWLADSISKVAQRVDVGDLSAYGLPRPDEGVFARGKRLGRAPVIVDREVVHAIRARKFVVVPTIEKFTGDTVHLIDGQTLEPEVVICATGYVRGLEPVVGHLGVLDDTGLPRVTGETVAAPGLRFVGFLSRPGLISFVAKQSVHVAKRIADELDRAPSLTP
ncbi:FAD dependent oxidoreductase [Mycolicibacterium mageritense DSM 44476 = CIP 104973]|uniref:Monooxygenase n=1 Tax=Mycolicibacterium mageritense TaxID=53462 RepID=A0AAI8U0P7_MYCME|nr:NAD(P)/FAD-dependent oxidoreductase [Mycolicibacterium mageritense]TXI59824.1 MAG: NAD(P)/FAD-dependent oxidoreductase [Mycolicibacterium mageritense]BBX37633.1 monooxygenase [Mycolicibacterium mageritense]BDY32344.1 putative oxidoreductase CzcO [Mycolicibacterium mageritense]CDO25703.1 FAD dependent oxidoreductase [Mycolicibacterium mageritense DSM 44476 = CIP 104973]